MEELTMNSVLKRLMAECTPKANGDVLSGTWGAALNDGHLYVDNIIKNSFRNILEPDRIQYVGYSKVSFEEELNLITTNTSSKPNWDNYDIGRSNMVLYKYKFEVDQTPIQLYLYLPYCINNSNIIEISGAKYHIIPIMTDKIISPKANEVFVKLYKRKLTYKSIGYTIHINDKRVPYNLVYVDVNKTNLSNPAKILGNVRQLASIQIFCKYGVKETFRRYLGLRYGEDYKIIRAEDIISGDVVVDTENFNIISTTSKKEGYENVVVLVNKKIDLSIQIMNYVCGLLYTTDLFYCNYPYLIDRIEENLIDKEISLWRTLFIIISYTGDKDFDAATNAAYKLFGVQLPTYITLDESNQLKEITKFEIQDYYDLCNYLIFSYENYINSYKDYNNNINNKYLEILYYIYYNTVVKFNKLVDACNKPGSNNLVARFKDAIKTIGRRSIFKSFSTSMLPLAVSALDNTLDTKYFKITSTLDNQNNGDGIYKKKKADKINVQDFVINPVDMFIGSILFLSKKKKNSAKYRANMFMSLDGLEVGITESEKNTVNKLKNMLVTITTTPTNQFEVDELDRDGEVIEINDVDIVDVDNENED